MKWEDVGGWFDQANYDGFKNLKGVPENPVIFESGTYCGRSTTAFGEIWPKARIFTCDPVDTGESRHLPKNATYFMTNSCDAPWKKEPIDILFIDNSHWYDDIKADFEKYSPLVKEGGYVVFHDYHFDGGGAEGVKQFVDELGGCEIDSAGEFGLAIMEKHEKEKA